MAMIFFKKQVLVRMWGEGHVCISSGFVLQQHYGKRGGSSNVLFSRSVCG